MPCFGTVAPSVLAADLTLGASASVLRSSLDILLIASIHSVLNQDVDILAWGEDMCGSPFPLIFSAESSVNESGPLKYSKNKLRGGKGIHHYYINNIAVIHINMSKLPYHKSILFQFVIG